MAVKTRQENREATYFVTFTCHQWLPLFEETQLYDYFYNWFGILKKNEIKILGFVIMPNHVHLLIYLPKDSPELFKVISNGKRFFAYEIVKRLENKNNQILLQRLESGVRIKESKNGKLHQVFKESYDAKECFDEKFILQKLLYIHKNPVSGKWNLAKDYLSYEHSSARFYDLNEENKNVKISHYNEV
jgi:REP element-mobilizing transposase RayT